LPGSQNYLAAVFGEGQVAWFDPNWTAAAPERAINCLVPMQTQKRPRLTKCRWRLLNRSPHAYVPGWVNKIFRIE
jgi:hypothetical protein